MSDARFYGRKRVEAEHGYVAGLLKVIDEYIRERKKVNPDSLGIKRAGNLKMRISHTLPFLDTLNETKIMWQMLEDVLAPRCAFPFSTSQTLRASVLRHLCEHLKISDDMISVTEKKLLSNEIKMDADLVRPQSLFKPYAKILRENTLRFLIGAALEKRAEMEAIPEQNLLMVTIKKVLEECEAQEVYKIMTSQWQHREKLNEHQMMCRLSKHLHLLTSTGHGVFWDDDQAALKIAAALCRHLKLDEKQIQSDINKQLGGPHYVCSPFGPIYEIHGLDRKIIDIRLDHINEALRLRANKEYVVVPFAPGKSVEMVSLCRK